MRKLILLSSVFILSFGAFAQQDVQAQWATSIQMNNYISKFDAYRQDFNNYVRSLGMDIEMAAEQATATEANAMRQNTAAANAQSVNERLSTLMKTMADVHMSTVNKADILCVISSSEQSWHAMAKNADKVMEEKTTKQLAELNQEEGTDSANGVTDQARKRYAKRTGTPADFDMSEWMNTASLPSDPIKLEEKLRSIGNAFGETFESVPPDLSDNPDTNLQAIIAKQTKLRAWEAAAITATNNVIKDKIGFAGSSSIESLTDRLEACGWEQADIQNFIGEGLSKEAYFETMTKWSSCPAMIIQRANAGTDGLLTEILAELTLSNKLAAAQWQRQGDTIVTQSGNIILGLEQPKAEVDAKIRSARRGQ